MLILVSTAVQTKACDENKLVTFSADRDPFDKLRAGSSLRISFAFAKLILRSG
jgi:hypothetical protein